MEFKTLLKWFGLLVLALVLFTGGGVSVSVGDATVDAAPPVESGVETALDTTWEWLTDVLALVPTLLSVGALGGLASGAVNLFKLLPLPIPVKAALDGNMGKISLVLNLAVFATFTFANLWGYGDRVVAFFETYGPVLPLLVSAFAALGGGKLFHTMLKKVDPVAFSLSNQLNG